MDDRYLDLEDDKKQPQSEASFSSLLDESENIVTKEFLRSLIIEAEEIINAQRVQIEELQKAQIELRDEVALQCYVPLLNVVSNHDIAASDAYRAADAFLRAREGGAIIRTNEELENEEEKHNN
jgi:uncharacterized protein YdcH (DUF465 family)